MEIEVGDYIINSDKYSMWIEEKFTGKDKSGKPIESKRRVTGYMSNFKMLLHSFIERKVRGSEAVTVEQLLTDMAKAEEDMKLLANALSERRENEF